jgi:hypothetical protein
MAAPGVESRSLDADATPGSGMMRENQGGDQSQAQPHSAAQTSQNAPARPAASGEHPGQRGHGGVLGLPAGTLISTVVTYLGRVRERTRMRATSLSLVLVFWE